VRIVAATNHNLPEMVKQGKFREDLLYRLNVIALHMPALRERNEDLEMLAERFLLRFARNYRRPGRGFTKAALDAIQRYPWPGNIRELQNVIERAVILCPSQEVDVNLLSIPGGKAPETRPVIGDPLSLDEIERAHIRGVLAISSSLDAAAHTLGIDVSTLYRKRKQYAL